MARRRKTVARHARLGAPSIARQLLSLFAVVVAVVVVAAGGVATYVALDLRGAAAENAVPLDDQPVEPPSLGAYEEPFSVLLVGTDECEAELSGSFGGRCKGPDAEGRRNDVNMLMHVSNNPRRVTVVSFPRDLMTPIPSCTREDGSTTSRVSMEQVNEAYGLGGLTCVADTIAELSGQSIPFAAKVSFGNVINITDAIGGVEVCIGNEGMRDTDTGIDWPAGPRTISGMDALQFLRTRHGVGDGSDLARIGNQQQYLSKLVRKIRSDDVLSDPALLYRLATTAAHNIEPSESLVDPIRLAQLALTLKDVPYDDIVFVQYPVLDDPANKDKVVADKTSSAALWTALDENRPLELTGQAGSNRGVIETTPTEEPAAPTPTDAAPSAPAPADTATELPSNINGSTANQDTCSNAVRNR